MHSGFAKLNQSRPPAGAASQVTVTEALFDRLVTDLIFEVDENRALRNLRRWRRLIRTFPEIVKPLGLKPPGRRGRPRGSRTLDPMQSLVAILAIDALKRKKADVLRLLGRATGPPDYLWLDRRLGYGRDGLRELDPQQVAELFDTVRRMPKHKAALRSLLTD